MSFREIKTEEEKKSRKPSDYASDQEVRWCPGCGDYAILKTMQRYFADENLSKDETVFISGIGCAARFPYYMDTFGFHTIHGRAPSVATGLKMVNPLLDIWIITGDGDGMAIGGNHTMHLLRRDIDLQMLLFNNRIYGLTKGQVSPTSPKGLRTPSTPAGSKERSIDPSVLALGTGATFVARGVDVDHRHLTEIIREGHKHRGTSFIEIWQNCIIYNDKAFSDVVSGQAAKEHQIFVQDGKPLLFGANNEKGLVFDRENFSLSVVDLLAFPQSISDVIVYDKQKRHLAKMVAELSYPDFPTAFGVLYQEELWGKERERGKESERERERDRLEGSLQAAMVGEATWRVL